MNIRYFVGLSVFTFFLSGCGAIDFQLQALSPVEVTATAQASGSASDATATVQENTPNLQASPTPNAMPEEVARIPSPDRYWTAILDRAAGSLEIENLQGDQQTVFPMQEGSMANDVRWSPDSTHLAIAVSHLPVHSGAGGEIKPPEIQLASLADGVFSNPVSIYRAADRQSPEQITLGTISPDNASLMFWLGAASFSIQMDGLPLWLLNIESGSTVSLSTATLVNLTYQSWSPDSQQVVFTDGSYRSAQVGKRLSTFDLVSGQTTVIVPEDTLVPGQVSWSPDGKTIAFAAVPAGQTGPNWANLTGWDNPAILARRIYLFDVSTQQFKRLNTTEVYQDAPRWSPDGTVLFYIQMDGQKVSLMITGPSDGIGQAIPNCQTPLPHTAGYYGQVDWSALYDSCPSTWITPAYATPPMKTTPTGGPVAITSWDQLIDASLVADVNWTLYTGQLEGELKGNPRTFAISYPSQWVVTLNPTPEHFAVQNVPETNGGGVAGDFVKLEIVPLKGALPEERAGEQYQVRLSGETGTLWLNVTSPGQALTISVTLEKDGVYYILSGYANLSEADQARLDKYKTMLLSMLASFQME